MDQQTEVLVRLLAEVDAVFRPCRRAQLAPARTAAAQARRAYRSAGLPFRSEQSGAGGRMAFGRMLLAMEADGLVTVAHMGRVREPSCRLTARGDQHARALCDLPGPIATLVLVDDVVRLAGVGRWCGERDLGAGDGESATDLAERALPGLVRGWLVCGDTARGGLFYAATEAGATADEESAGEWPDWTSAAADLYYQTLQSAQARLAEADVGGEIGPIPLSGCTVTGDSAQGWEV